MPGTRFTPRVMPARSFDDEDPGHLIDRALEAAREMLGMDAAYLADMRRGLQHYRHVAGDGESFDIQAGSATPLDGTYCEAMLQGRLDGVVRDASEHVVARRLQLTHRASIGSYIGVPVRLRDGELYGTFCCLSHAPSPSLRERDVRFMRVLAKLVAHQLEREARVSHEWRIAAATGSVQALMAGLEARDGYTELHSRAVVELAVSIGRRLGLSESRLTDLKWAAQLHDIGKIGIPDAILRKQGELAEEEWEQMRRHPEIGERIIASTPTLSHLAPAIRAEHERWDGSGYPDGLSRTRIPLASRIVLVSDAYHAMTSDRPYRAALRAEIARAELERHAGSQFCPAVVPAALDILEQTAPA